ncbi:Thermosensitive gluconokinase [Echinococcus granulosus]|nr:Thermosensitive gluconokinase [Echinococcus granulosus]EUB60633.1 Thermosensitive gluconokinase [Echinococcus granulosus]CDS23484.1 carbohydrate kinase thermoresistant glucokinase [Echinococcus granulosus]
MVPIVLMGPSGCGKSTIAFLLQSKLHCTFIEGDVLHPNHNISKMSSGVPLTDEDRLPWLERIHSAITEARLYSQSTPVIVTCSALKRQYREVLTRPPNTDILFIFLEAPRDVLEARVCQREGHFLPPSIVQSQLETLEVPSVGMESFLTVDATLQPGEIVAKILGKLGLTQ